MPGSLDTARRFISRRWAGAWEVFALFKYGGAGVDLFMVLSGFCLFLPLCRSDEALAKFQWKNFYQRRARRIIPPYYAGILFATLMPFALTVFFRSAAYQGQLAAASRNALRVLRAYFLSAKLLTAKFRASQCVILVHGVGGAVLSDVSAGCAGIPSFRPPFYRAHDWRFHRVQSLHGNVYRWYACDSGASLFRFLHRTLDAVRRWHDGGMDCGASPAAGICGATQNGERLAFLPRLLCILLPSA